MWLGACLGSDVSQLMDSSLNFNSPWHGRCIVRRFMTKRPRSVSASYGHLRPPRCSPLLNPHASASQHEMDAPSVSWIRAQCWFPLKLICRHLAPLILTPGDEIAANEARKHSRQTHQLAICGGVKIRKLSWTWVLADQTANRDTKTNVIFEAGDQIPDQCETHNIRCGNQALDPILSEVVECTLVFVAERGVLPTRHGRRKFETSPRAMSCVLLSSTNRALLLFSTANRPFL